jgi:hypothetical protein
MKIFMRNGFQTSVRPRHRSDISVIVPNYRSIIEGRSRFTSSYVTNLYGIIIVLLNVSVSPMYVVGGKSIKCLTIYT